MQIIFSHESWAKRADILGSGSYCASPDFSCFLMILFLLINVQFNTLICQHVGTGVRASCLCIRVIPRPLGKDSTKLQTFPSDERMNSEIVVVQQVSLQVGKNQKALGNGAVNLLWASVFTSGKSKWWWYDEDRYSTRIYCR